MLQYTHRLPLVENLFQSSSNPKVGCYVKSSRLIVHNYCFNPHPTRRLDATLQYSDPSLSIVTFQSSSNPKVGCYLGGRRGTLPWQGVSILIQPEGWMLRQNPRTL